MTSIESVSVLIDKTYLCTCTIECDDSTKSYKEADGRTALIEILSKTKSTRDIRITSHSYNIAAELDIVPIIVGCYTLTNIHIYGCIIIGSIDTVLQCIPKLELLSLNRCTIDIESTELCHLRLRILSLHSTVLNRTDTRRCSTRISLNLNGLISLESLYINSCNIELPLFNDCTALQTVDLRWIRNIVRLPDLKSDRLTELRIEYCTLSNRDIFWQQICQLTSLTKLYIVSCRLAGQIPESIKNLTNLRVMDLSYNSLSGYIPRTIDRLPLENLRLEYNDLSGDAAVLYNCKSLLSIDVSSNLLLININRLLEELPELEFLAVYNNRTDPILLSHISNRTKTLNMLINTDDIVDYDDRWKILPRGTLTTYLTLISSACPQYILRSTL